MLVILFLSTLSYNPTKLANTLRQFVGNSVFCVCIFVDFDYGADHLQVYYDEDFNSDDNDTDEVTFRQAHT